MADLILVDSTIFISLLRRGIDPALALGRWAGLRDTDILIAAAARAAGAAVLTDDRHFDHIPGISCICPTAICPPH